MAYVIKDSNTGEYYRQRLGSKGWYSSNIDNARLYAEEKPAHKTIADNGHHVSYPGNRNLNVVQVKLTEV